jgi:hypothetical protein
LLLRYSILALGLQDVRREDVRVEDAAATTQHEGRGLVLLRAEAPCKADPGSEVAFVGDVVLDLVAQAVAEGEVLAQLPVVLEEGSDVGNVNERSGVAGGDGVLAGTGDMAVGVGWGAILTGGQRLRGGLVGVE